MRLYYGKKDEDEQAAGQSVGIIDALFSFVESEIRDFGGELDLCNHQ